MDQSNAEHIWVLIARKLSGEATTEELHELNEMLRKDPGAGYAKEILHDLWLNQPQPDMQYSENRYKELIQQIKNMGIDEGKFTHGDHLINSDEELRTKSSKNQWLIALSTVAVVIILTCLYYLPGVDDSNKILENTQTKNEISTKNGSTSLVLPDGTKVWLNSASQLVYDKNYGNKLREVTLTGEAYFDVVKNPEKPFVIHTHKMDVKVLGTAFNVKCYPGEKTIETSLVRGSIEVTLKDSQRKIELKPNDKLIINNDEYIGQKSNEKILAKESKKIISQNEKLKIDLRQLTLLPTDSTIVETAWVQNRLVFSAESFEEVVLKMERFYNIKIEFSDEKLKEERLTGNFEKETITDALHALQLTTKFYFSIKNNNIKIYK